MSTTEDTRRVLTVAISEALAHLRLAAKLRAEQGDERDPELTDAISLLVRLRSRLISSGHAEGYQAVDRDRPRLRSDATTRGLQP